MKRQTATLLREYGPFPDVTNIGGVTYDGVHVWIATGDKLRAIDPESGRQTRSLDIAANAGSAFDGRHLYQISGDRIQKVDPETGRVLSTVPTPEGGASGMAWAEGRLWVAQYTRRKIHQVDPETGAILRSIESNRFVTGVTWVEGELWHATMENEESEIRRVDPETGAVLESLFLPKDVHVSGMEWDGGERFYCGGARSGKLRAVARPKSGSRAA